MSNSHKIDLKTRIWKTYECRFIAEKRLKSNLRWAQFSSCLLPLYLIALSVMQIGGWPSWVVNKMLPIGVFNVVASVSILTLSVFITFSGFSEKAAKYLQTANDMKSLYQRFELSAGTESDMQALESDYQKILEYSENHENSDWIAFKYSKRSQFADQKFSLIEQSINWFTWRRHVFAHVALILLPPVGLSLMAL